ncbi:Nn.00g057000.m01.CDS01 [Neocucurbitaria sp. VM-36]
MAAPPTKWSCVMPTGLSREEADDITLRNQTESPLLRLPGEIRNKIYDYAFSGHIIHVFGNEPNHSLYGSVDWLPVGYSLSMLIKTTTLCRQIRSETALLPFGCNKFWVSPPLLPDFLTTLGPQQRDAIKVVGVSVVRGGRRIDHFLPAMECWLELTGLSRVDVKLYDSQLGDAQRLQGWVRDIFKGYIPMDTKLCFE